MISWNKNGLRTDVKEDSMVCQIKEMKKRLKVLHVQDFTNIDGKTNLQQEQQQIAQETLARGPNDLEAQGKERQSMIEYKFWLRIKESVLKQKAMVQWLKLGDANKHYFQQMLKREIQEVGLIIESMSKERQ